MHQNWSYPLQFHRKYPPKLYHKSPPQFPFPELHQHPSILWQKPWNQRAADGWCQFHELNLGSTLLCSYISASIVYLNPRFSYFVVCPSCSCCTLKEEDLSHLTYLENILFIMNKTRFKRSHINKLKVCWNSLMINDKVYCCFCSHNMSSAFWNWMWDLLYHHNHHPQRILFLQELRQDWVAYYLQHSWLSAFCLQQPVSFL